MTTNTSAQSFIDRYSAEMHEVETQLSQAVWELETTSSDEAKKNMVETEVRFNAIFQRPEDWAEIRRLRQWVAAEGDVALTRQVERLFLAFASNQDKPERVEAIARLSADVGADFTSHRAVVGGREVSDNDVNEILRSSADSETVREAWEAGKAIGPVVAERVVELAEMRNEGARELGYRDFYDKSLKLQEIDESFLFDLFDDLDRQTAGPFASTKARLDQRLAARFGIELTELMPWHYVNPFFQEPPPLTDVSLDPVFAGRDVVELSKISFDRLGLEVRDILGRSDLYERPKKNQHAFEIHIDSLTDDVRVLCNVRSDEYWMTTMLHELGHAVYDAYLSPDLPYLLRSIAHINTTEGIAMIMGRLTRNGAWLREVGGVDEATAGELSSAADTDLRFMMLTFVRWVLVMTRFERALYENPRRGDLNRLWWELVSRYQLLQPPPERVESGAHQDWAAKIHLALYPVYYHNYLLGELTASQIQDTLTDESGGSNWFLEPSSGELLRRRLFDLGATYRWDETVGRVTGRPLDAGSFVRHFVTGKE